MISSSAIGRDSDAGHEHELRKLLEEKSYLCTRVKEFFSELSKDPDPHGGGDYWGSGQPHRADHVEG